jgi:hypothetical protein
MTNHNESATVNECAERERERDGCVGVCVRVRAGYVPTII